MPMNNRQSTTYQALVAEERDDHIALTLQTKQAGSLQEGETAIAVHYSSLNYKDALAASKGNKVVQAYPIVPGIDLAGVVIASNDARHQEGDPVIVTGYGLGVSRDGGFGEQARVPGDWLVPLPAGLNLEEAMLLGTAGFTAALSILKLEAAGLCPESGPVLVTGASGGVGSLAVAMLANLGYEVIAATGKETAHAYLRKIGAADVIPREELRTEPNKPLFSGKWAGAVDTVGGEALSFIVSSLQYGGAVASCGLTAGAAVNTTVYPFILRGVQWIGIDSAYCPMPLRKKVWHRLANDLKLNQNQKQRIMQKARLQDVPHRIKDLLQGKVRGRIVVSVKPSGL